MKKEEYFALLDMVWDTWGKRVPYTIQGWDKRKALWYTFGERGLAEQKYAKWALEWATTRDERARQEKRDLAEFFGEPLD